MESFTVRDLSFSYPERADMALHNVSFSVCQGEFITLCGPSGCGKTTLLRHLKPALAPHGTLSGDILFEGRPLGDMPPREQSAGIGFVMQNPDNQIVTDKVWHELAFGLESLGHKTPEIRLRVAEMASFFGIQTWFYKPVTELSGGQKQLLNLASVMAMQPGVLILDEPTSQLDPIAASEFLATVGKINRELGVTVILTEHRLEEAFPLSDRVIVMDRGAIIADGAPRETGLALRGRGHGMFLAMPSAMRVWAAVSSIHTGGCPVTVRDGASWLAQLSSQGIKPLPPAAPPATGDAPNSAVPAVEFDGVWFKYEKDAPDVIKGLSYKAYPGELLAILGGNGTGKTTAISLAAGANKPYRGKIRINGRPLSEYAAPYDALLGVLPQSPQTLFVKKTVREDLREMSGAGDVLRIARLCRVDALLERHPYDLSGGEQQRAALAKVLLLKPRILLLDEPTKGLDAEFKLIFAAILRELTAAGVCVIMVSHDVEFCAEHAGRCALFFDGNIVSEGVPREFFPGNSFYTTAANRMARRFAPEAVTAADLIAALGGSDGGGTPGAGGQPPGERAYDLPPEPPSAEPPRRKKLPLWRKLLGGAAGIIALAVMYMAVTEPEIDRIIGSGGAKLYVALLAALLVLTASVSRRSERPIAAAQMPAGHRKLPRRTVMAAAMILLAIPLTIFVGDVYLGDRKYYFIALLILVETMLPFALIFEGRRPKARELIIISVLCAIGVAGRSAFFMLPQFKPVVAVVIISGVAFGGETGFLVGAVIMLTSNIIFRQGPWTPWQMFAMGAIGFLAGILFKKGLLLRTRLPLCIFGALATLVIYGGIMNPAYLLIYQPNPKPAMLIPIYLAGLPFDLVHALATAFFLWFGSRPMLEKLDRIKVKYGLL
ncbi:MAG: ATP-binding cassette domain-containing protein [Oscillospiraceae bacterium]|jgi:energy-coupling factor transport system ATP-binding protein|nr:ATP-binding cassette domain-containing protein [Oscillospiraceae bacterium]